MRGYDSSMPTARHGPPTLVFPLASAFGAAVLGTLAGFAVSRLSAFGKEEALALIFSALLLPGVSILPVLCQGLRALGGLYSLGMYSIYSCAMAMPVGAFLSYGAIRNIRRSVIEAAILDGASESRLFWSIHLPLSLRPIGYAALIGFFLPWFDAIAQFTLLFSIRPPATSIFGACRTLSHRLFFAESFIVGVQVAICMLLAWRYAFLGVFPSLIRNILMSDGGGRIHGE